MDILLIDKDSGETVTLTGIGSGQDGGDKAVMKAQTAAIKYAYMLSLAISTGDDPEADSKTDESVGTTVAQIKQGGRKEAPKAVAAGQVCEKCGVVISDRVGRYSMKKYGKSLCMDCQKEMQSIA